MVLRNRAGIIGTHGFFDRVPGISCSEKCAEIAMDEELLREGMSYGSSRTLPVVLSMTQRDTVTVAVLFMNPAFVTTPKNDMGGMLSCPDERSVAMAGTLPARRADYPIKMVSCCMDFFLPLQFWLKS